MPELCLQTFGGLAIQREGGPAEGAGAQRRRLALLALLAATAWDAAGRRDSAIVRYEQGARNWRNAEPMFGARIERARLRIAALRAGR